MKKQFKHLLVAILTVSSLLATNACKKDHFDEPPGNTTDPNLPVNITIADLVALHVAGGGDGTFQKITDDKTIVATVIADDRSGNFYKSIVIDDGTAGITLALDKSSLYNDYPIGRKIYVKLNGLTIGDNGGLPEIGGGVDTITDPLQPALASISSILITKYVVKGPTGQTIPIQHVSVNAIKSLNTTYLNRLIQLDSVEFRPSDAGKTWGGIIGGSSGGYINRTLEQCPNTALNKIIVSTGAYATFSQHLTPTGNGTLFAIYSVYSGAPQLVMRDETDAQLNDTTRCNGTVIIPPTLDTSGTYITIADLKALYTGTPGAAITSDVKIRGSVISDLVNKNEQDKNAIIQDATAGIIVRFEAAHTFTVGKEVVVKFSMASLDSVIKFGGVFQAGGKTPLTHAIAVGTKPVTPQVVTVSQLTSNIYNYESTLVKVLNFHFSERSSGSGTSGTYSYSKLDVNDGSTIQLYTTSSALFKTTTYPTGSPLTSIVAIALPYTSSSGFNGKELKIRNTADVTP